MFRVKVRVRIMVRITIRTRCFRHRLVFYVSLIMYIDWRKISCQSLFMTTRKRSHCALKSCYSISGCKLTNRNNATEIAAGTLQM